jgi:hypothetical protein
MPLLRQCGLSEKLEVALTEPGLGSVVADVPGVQGAP